MMDVDWVAWGPPLAAMGIAIVGSLAWLRRLDLSSEDEKQISDAGSRADLDQGKSAVLAELRQLELDRKKLDPADYMREREALIARGANYLEQLDLAEPTEASQLEELVVRLQALREEVGERALIEGLTRLDINGFQRPQMGAEWRGALFALAAVAVAALMVNMAADESRLRVGDEPMTGTSSAPPGMPSARAQLEAKLASNPSDITTINQLTQLSLGENDLGAAQNYNQQALAIEGSNREARMYRAVLAGLVGMHDRSIAYLDELLAEEPDFAAALSYKGIIAVEAGMPEVAIPALERAIALQGNHPALEAALRRAQGKPMGRPVPKSTAKTGDAPASAASLVAAGSLSLGSTAQTPSEGATLFIAVRDPAGGPPLAALKRPARFPQDFEITSADAIAMGGQPRPFPPQVKLVIRVDTDGNAMTREEGAATIEKLIDLGSEDLALELN